MQGYKDFSGLRVNRSKSWAGAEALGVLELSSGQEIKKGAMSWALCVWWCPWPCDKVQGMK